MTELDEVKRILKGIDDPTERQLRFAALLARELGVSTEEFIVVGGSATAIFTDGQYASGDIDAVLTARLGERTRTLRGWGFKQQGRQWYNDDLRIYMDFVKPPYTFDISRTQVIATPEGQVRVAAIEDLLVKWLMSAKFWHLPKDIDHARVLAVSNRDRIDWVYVQGLAESQDVADFLAALRTALGMSPSESEGPPRARPNRGRQLGSQCERRGGLSRRPRLTTRGGCILSPSSATRPHSYWSSLSS